MNILRINLVWFTNPLNFSEETMLDRFLMKLTIVPHWRKLFDTTKLSTPDPLWVSKYKLNLTVFLLALLGFPLNSDNWSKILLGQSVPLKAIQSFLHFSY